MSYAWGMVAVTFFTQFLAMGFTFYSFGIVLKPLAAEFGGGRLGVTMLPVAMSLAGGVMSPFLGKWVARGSIRDIMTLGCLLMGVGFLLGSRATELWQLGVLFGTCLAFGMGTMGGITSQALVVNWFEKGRPMALGISLMGVSASGVAMSYVCTALVEAGGWRWAFEVFGWATLCAIPLVWSTVVGHPDERKQRPYTAESATSPQTREKPPTIPIREGLRERNLWIISIVCGISFMATSAVLTHVIAFSTDKGLEATQAASILAALAAGAAAGKIVFGWLAGRIGEQSALYLSLGLECLGILSLTFETPFSLLIVIALLLGLGIGGVMPLGAALIVRAFGPKAFGPMMGLLTPIMIPFQMLGAPFAAGIFDSTCSYRGAWFAFVVSLVLACGLLSLLRLENLEPTEVSEPAPQQV
ncbi:MAG: MFS transporter [Deltaproteobacteria bacterium]|nr:MFS transporter [Deltaproteobacteria bacterium]